MSVTRSDAEIVTAVRDSFFAAPPAQLGIALSGGGDSLALLHILTRTFEPGQVALFAATVDHRLRDGSRAEAEQAAAQAAALGVPHDILTWEPGWDGTGNLQDRAREARYRLLTDWARGRNIAVLALGHTADDQAETVLMRLARASGVTGLSAMRARRVKDGLCLMRPLLELSRAELRAYLTRVGLTWIEDPSNDDLRFDRVRVRRALGVLDEIGITPRALSAVARNMDQAREALDWYSFLAARDHLRVEAGDVLVDLRGFRTLPDEIARRLVLRALAWIGGGPHPPRRSAAVALVDAMRRGQAGTLAGCRVLCTPQGLRICREYNAVRRHHRPAGDLWDGRWRLHSETDDGAGAELRPLGRRGLMACPDWRETARPNASLVASPSVWRGDDLVAAPLAGWPQGWQATLDGGVDAFFASFLSH